MTPKPNEKFVDREGKIYTVEFIANLQSKDKDNFPHLIIFRDLANYAWCLPLETFIAHFTKV